MLKVNNYNKKCYDCLIEKDVINFVKQTQSKDGLCRYCKECYKKRYSNPEKTRKRYKEYWEENKEHIRKKNREYMRENGKHHTIYMRKYRKENKEKVNSKRRETENKRLKEDPLFKLQQSIRGRINEMLTFHKWQKRNKFAQYIGCTIEELKIYLEKQFQPGMTWKNHNLKGWHLDHIYPLSRANTVEELYKLCHYTNLQPLWAKDNISKSNKIKT